MIEITEEALWARIGRLTVECELLRARLAELEQAQRPTEGAHLPQGAYTKEASP